MTMPEELHVGRVATLERLVTPELTADRWGNPGALVFSTPALLSLLEETAFRCVAPALSEGQGTVGTHVDMRHLAATPIGMTVTARAELTEVDGRRLVFKVEAQDAREPVASGTHERFIIGSMEKFLARAAEKATAP